MSQIYVDPEVRHPLYPRAMPLARVAPGVQIVTLDTNRGNLVRTVLASKWRLERVAIAANEHTLTKASFFCLRAESVDSGTIDLCKRGIHPPVEASEYWDLGHFSVEAERNEILDLYPWLVKEGFLRAANELEDTFFEYFVDNSTFWDKLLRRRSA